MLGVPVHAASFIRERRIVLETALLEHPRKLRLILIHELFHFVWTRLGNALRRSFAGILERERQGGARGELGESAGTKKASAPWKVYVYESFCDTAAWMYAGVNKTPEFTLAAGWRNKRRAWFELYFVKPRKA